MAPTGTVIAMANGRADAPVIEGRGAEFDRFAGALADLCGELARKIAPAGEGATKLLVVDVAGVPDHEMARELARSVAGSSLVKAGVFGGDPSTGRILAALGAGIGARSFSVDPARVSLVTQGTRVYDERGPVALDPAAREALNARLKESEIV